MYKSFLFILSLLGAGFLISASAQQPVLYYAFEDGTGTYISSAVEPAVSNSVSIAYAGAPVAIPDAGSVDIPVNVSGLAGTITDVRFRIEGGACSTTLNEPGNGIAHSAITNLTISLVSPVGTVIQLMDQAGGLGTNLCQVVFSDAATNLFDTVTATNNPYSGDYLPITPFGSLFNENPNGDWLIRIADGLAANTGTFYTAAIEIETGTPGGSLKGNSGDERWVAGAPNGSTPGGALDFDGENNNANGDAIDTGKTIASLGMIDQAYTASAWIKPEFVGGDRFVFGSLGPTFFHLGMRGEVLRYGHYGNDLSGESGVRPDRWIHVTWLYSEGTQQIYLNGELDNGPALRGLIQETGTLWISRAQNASRAFNGVIDEVAVWDTALAQNQIEALASGASPTNLPPATIPALNLPLISFQGTNGLWNVYQPIGIGAGFGVTTTWEAAYTNATNSILQLDANSYTGHLVWVESLEENALVHLIANKANVYIGATDNETFGGTETGIGGWVWAGNGADTPPPFVYHNFFTPGEPNNAGGGEDAAHLRADAFWNDQGSGLPSDRAGAGSPAYASVIEWETQLSEPYPGSRVIRQALPDTLPGTGGGAGLLSAYELTDSSACLTVEQAIDNLLSTNGIVNTGYIPTMNVSDPENAGDDGRFIESNPLLGNTAGDDNYISAVYKGTIVIPTSGEWSFGNRADNVTALRIVGQTFLWATGNLFIDPIDTSTVYTRPNTGDNGRAGVMLDAGEYDIEIIGGEQTGGAQWEWFTSSGRFFNEADSSAWRLIGDAGGNVVGIPGMVVTNLTTWTVASSEPGGTQVLNIADGEADLVVSNTVSDQVDLNFRDPNNGGTGSIPGDRAFPNDTGADDQDFALKAEGFIEIPIDGVYQFGFQGDDGGYLQIHSQTWDRIIVTATGNSTINGDRIQCDCLTGNSRTIGQVTLTAGIYPATAFFFERSGGAYWEVFGAGISQSPVLLTANGAGTLELDPGLALTGPVIGGDIVIDSIFYDAMGPSVTFTWQSGDSASYRIEASTDARGWTPIATGVASQGATTTVLVAGPFSSLFTVFRIAQE